MRQTDCGMRQTACRMRQTDRRLSQTLEWTRQALQGFHQILGRKQPPFLTQACLAAAQAWLFLIQACLGRRRLPGVGSASGGRRAAQCLAEDQRRRLPGVGSASGARRGSGEIAGRWEAQDRAAGGVDESPRATAKSFEPVVQPLGSNLGRKGRRSSVLSACCSLDLVFPWRVLMALVGGMERQRRRWQSRETGC
jgi:hypothetical protein